MSLHSPLKLQLTSRINYNSSDFVFHIFVNGFVPRIKTELQASDLAIRMPISLITPVALGTSFHFPSLLIYLHNFSLSFRRNKEYEITQIYQCGTKGWSSEPVDLISCLYT